MSLLSNCIFDSLFLMTLCFGVLLIAVLGFLADFGSGNARREEKGKQNS